ncbi:MAG: cytochrome P450 [Sphingomonadales bacterium]|nr:cytochrome P450 [Sphingomonadales bacterium]
MTAQPPAHVPPERVVDIDIYALPGQPDDFHRAWQALQQSAPPVVWTPRNEGHWIALGGDVLAEVQSDHTRFSNRVIVVPKSVGEKHGLIPTTIDPPEHRPYRKLLNDGMALAKVRKLHDSIRAVAAELIDGFIARGSCDFTGEYAQVLPIRIFLALVNLPMADAANIRMWAECMTRPNPPMPFEAGKQALYDYLDPIIAARRATPGDDLLSQIVTAQIDGRELSRDEALALGTQILVAGVDTVVNFLGFVLLFLARNPDARAELAAKDANGVMAATNELFRRFGLVTIARTVREDMDFHGCPLKAGELVCIPTQVHGLDEGVNPDALTVDFARRGGRHSAFGSGPHMCPGQELARAEVAITIQEWLRRIPDFRIAADADTRCSGGLVGQINRVILEWDA